MLGEADEVEHLARAPTAGRAVLAAQFEAERDVVEHGQVREEAVGLEDHAHVALVGRYPRDVAAADLDVPGGRVVQAGEDPSTVVLPQPEGPSRATSSPGPSEVEAVQGPEGAEVAGEVCRPTDLLAPSSLPGRPSTSVWVTRTFLHWYVGPC